MASHLPALPNNTYLNKKRILQVLVIHQYLHTYSTWLKTNQIEIQMGNCI